MDLLSKKCVPCEGSTKPLNSNEEENLLLQIKDWTLIKEREHRIIKEFQLKNFVGAVEFVNKIAVIAEKEGHHPNIFIHSYNKVNVEIFTHAIGGLSENDFIVAAKIDEILK
ncbi:MAG: 4a-hydroxytetrahydrobiopterin dehydratase [Ignavibacteriae bacterium]|nr:4a-hydroxytetrahydrobiopterin dehydratase [Ignavibacteriota bacterium]